jgi:hypothetical protein
MATSLLSVAVLLGYQISEPRKTIFGLRLLIPRNAFHEVESGNSPIAKSLRKPITHLGTWH